jgi:peptidyl-tRNA hydrolase, PTH2 family
MTEEKKEEPGEIKMVIAVRRDLHMTRGKEIAQACHACLGAILRGNDYEADKKHFELNHIRTDEDTLRWLEEGCAKICVKVNSEQELFDLEAQAKQAGLNCCLIVDAGRTMFHGEATPTCIAIGPARADRIDPVTGGLQLY